MSIPRAPSSQYISVQMSTGSIGAIPPLSTSGTNILPPPLVICDTWEESSKASCDDWYQHSGAVCPPQVILRNVDACPEASDSGISEQASPCRPDSSPIVKTVPDPEEPTVVRSASDLSHGFQCRSSHSSHRTTLYNGFPAPLDAHDPLSRPLDSEPQGPQQVGLIMIPPFVVKY